MLVSSECFVVLGRGLCFGLTTCPQKFAECGMSTECDRGTS